MGCITHSYHGTALALDTLNANHTFLAPSDGVLQVGLSYVQIEETTAQDTTDAVLGLSIAGTNAGTLTIGDAVPVNTGLHFVPATTGDNANDGFFEFSKGDAIKVNVDTPGADTGTEEGTFRPHLVIELRSDLS